MRLHKLLPCMVLACLLAVLCAFGAAADTTVGVTGAGTFKMEQAYVNVPELDVYFYALDADGNSYSSIKVQAAGPELTLGDRKLEVRSVAVANDPICYIVALDNSADLNASEFYTMLGGVRKLVNAMGDGDQLMLYTTAGETTCVLPATSDKNLMYKAIGSVKQAEGSMDTTQLVSAVYSEIQSDYQALAPRKAAMIVTDATQVLPNMALFGTLASDVGDKIGMAAYVYLMTDQPRMFETLEQAAGGKLVLCEASTLGDALKKQQAYFVSALEIRTEVPESLYGERLETLTLAMPQLGSAIKNSQTVYMGHKLTKPQVTKVETLRRDKLRLTFNQPINENANKPQLYEVRSKDIWNWRVQVKSVEIAEDGRTATLEIEPLYKGEYTVALNRVSGKMSAANVSSSRDTTTFKVVVWPRDREFYFARFRVPLLLAALLLLVLGGSWQAVRRRDRAAEKEAEAEHLLAGAGEPDALPRRWVTLFWSQRSSIAESRWAGMVESSLILGSDAAQCDLCLPDRKISPQHCVLIAQGDALLVQPLSDRAKVYVNGERIDGEHRLQNNDTLRLGKTTVRLVL
ncbi:FHA domain-containing protein [Gemmiger sp.]